MTFEVCKMSENILYGGPPLPPVANPNAPFGEVILQKLVQHGNKTILVKFSLIFFLNKMKFLTNVSFVAD